MAGPTDITRAARKRARPILLGALRAAGSLPCPRCGQPMTYAQCARLDVGHTRDVADGGARSPLRLEHTECNRRAGDRRRGRHAPPAPYAGSRAW